MSLAQYKNEIESIKRGYRRYIHDFQPGELIRDAIDSIRTLLEDLKKFEFDESFGFFNDNDLCQTLDFHYGKLDALLDKKIKITNRQRLPK